MLSALVAALSLAGSAAAQEALPDHTILTNVNVVTMGRMDPIVNPGTIGDHVHTIMGASNFRTLLNTPEEQQRAVCSTARVNADKSSYWAPTLYYMHENNTFEAMVPFNTRIYYFTKNETNMHPFPPGMRIVSGTAMARDTSDPRTHGVELSCGGPHSYKHLPNGTSNPTCESLHAGIRFPSCGWANKSLDSWNHFDHLTWPVFYGADGPSVDTNGGVCPPSHPIHYPTIFMQSFYKFDEWRPWKAGRNNVVWSNGDTLGASFHGDFVNGWDEGVLSNFVKQCNYPNGKQDRPELCPAFAPTANVEETRNCSYQGQVPAEDIGLYRAISQLPGCNKIWGADGGDTKPACEGGENPGFVAPNVFYGQGFEVRVPLYVPDAGNFTEMTVNAPFPAWMGRWGGADNQIDTAGGITFGNTFGGPTVMTSSADDVLNRVSSPVDKVAGMVDSSEFTVDMPPKGASAPTAPAASPSSANTTSDDASAGAGNVTDLPGGALVANHPDVNIVDGTANTEAGSYPGGGANIDASGEAASASPSGQSASPEATSAAPSGSSPAAASNGSAAPSSSGTSGKKKCNKRRRAH